MIQKFSKKTSEALGSYVYVYSIPVICSTWCARRWLCIAICGLLHFVWNRACPLLVRYSQKSSGQDLYAPAAPACLKPKTPFITLDTLA